MKLFQVQNLLISLKAISTSIVTGLITFILYGIGRWFIQDQKIMIGAGIILLTFVLYLFLWGSIAKKFWKWN